MYGMSYKDGVPHVWGQPCVQDDDVPPVLADVLSIWRCPHCNARLGMGSGREICLNACHLTAPQARKFQDSLREAGGEAR